MPIRSDVVGCESDSIELLVDARWLMAFAAGVGGTLRCYFDTTRPDGIIGHPIFPAALEFNATQIDPAIQYGLQGDEVYQGVHAASDMYLFRPVRENDRIVVHRTVTGVERREPGAYQVSLIEGRSSTGETIWKNYMSILFRDVEVVGDNVPAPQDPAALEIFSADESTQVAELHVDSGRAHVYAECARLWNPTHTDVRVARAVGLPDTILHGTATMSIVASKLVELFADADPARLKRIAARFGGPVFMPSVLQLHVAVKKTQPNEMTLCYMILGPDRPVITRGLACIRV